SCLARGVLVDACEELCLIGGRDARVLGRLARARGDEQQCGDANFHFVSSVFFSASDLPSAVARAVRVPSTGMSHVELAPGMRLARATLPQIATMVTTNESSVCPRPKNHCFICAPTDR